MQLLLTKICTIWWFGSFLTDVSSLVTCHLNFEANQTIIRQSNCNAITSWPQTCGKPVVWTFYIIFRIPSIWCLQGTNYVFPESLLIIMPHHSAHVHVCETHWKWHIRNATNAIRNVLKLHCFFLSTKFFCYNSQWNIRSDDEIPSNRQ